MPATYEPIATTTLGSAAANIEFTSIGSGYTDLRLILTGTANTFAFVYMQYNGDTASNYSATILSGNGTSASSIRTTSAISFFLSENASINAVEPCLLTVDIFNYAGSTNKTCLATKSADRNGAGGTNRTVGLWRQTSAITSIKIFLNGANTMSSGTTATLYGILKA
jgi:hypothetical protein